MLEIGKKYHIVLKAADYFPVQYMVFTVRQIKHFVLENSSETYYIGDGQFTNAVWVEQDILTTRFVFGGDIEFSEEVNENPAS